jgi:hypothetical protein
MDSFMWCIVVTLSDDTEVVVPAGEDARLVVSHAGGLSCQDTQGNLAHFQAETWKRAMRRQMPIRGEVVGCAAKREA